LGVKYHAELAAIERKWMHMKQSIRGFMNGSLPHLKDQLELNWSAYTVLSARKDMRHCRDTCAVYRELGLVADLTKLQSGQHEYKSHRRVFDGATNMLRSLVAPEGMTEKQAKKAATMQKRKVQQIEKESDMKRCLDEFNSKKRRRDHNSKKSNDWVDKRKFNNKPKAN
jgi:hypothetical protein